MWSYSGEIFHYHLKGLLVNTHAISHDISATFKGTHISLRSKLPILSKFSFLAFHELWFASRYFINGLYGVNHNSITSSMISEFTYYASGLIGSLILVLVFKFNYSHLDILHTK